MAERLVPAIVLIGIGAFFLLNNLHIVYFREIFGWWPALLIAYGIVKLVDSSDNSGTRLRRTGRVRRRDSTGAEPGLPRRFHPGALAACADWRRSDDAVSKDLAEGE